MKCILLLCLFVTASLHAQEFILPTGSFQTFALTADRHAPVVVSQNGTRLFLPGSSPGQLRMVDTVNGNEFAVFTAGKQPLKQMHLIRNDSKLLAIDNENAYLWDIASQQLQAICPDSQPRKRLIAFAVSGNGEAFVTLAADYSRETKSFQLQVWSTQSGKLVAESDMPVSNWSDDYQLVLSHDADKLALFPRNMRVQPQQKTEIELWNVEPKKGQTGAIHPGKPLQITSYGVSTLAFHPDGKQIILSARHPLTIPKNPKDKSLEKDSELLIYDLESLKPISRWNTKLNNAMTQLVFNEKGNRLIGLDTNLSQVAVWDTATWQAVLFIKRDYEKWRLYPDISTVRFVDDDHIQMGIVSNGVAGRWLLELQKAGELKPVSPPGQSATLSHASQIKTFLVSNDQQTLYTADENSLICVWDLPNRRLLRNLTLGYPDKYFIVRRGGMQPTLHWSSLRPTLSPDAKYLVRNGMGLHLLLTEVATSKHQKLLLEVEDKPQVKIVLKVAFSPDNRLLLAAWKDGAKEFVQVWEMSTGKTRWKRTDLSELDWVFSADSRKISSKIHTVSADTGSDIKPGGLESLAHLNSETIRLLDQTTNARCLGSLSDGRTVLGRCWSAGPNGPGRHLILWIELSTSDVRANYALPGREVLETVQLIPNDLQFLATNRAFALFLWDLIPTPPANPASLTDTELDQHWKTLAQLRAAPAWQSMLAMIRDPARSLPYLSKQASIQPHGTSIAELIAELDDADFKKRDRAGKLLQAIGPPAKAALEAIINTGSPEQSRRAKLLIQELANVDLERVRTIRVVEIVERINTPEAIQLLEKWAQLDANSVLVVEAKAALGRLKK